MLFTMRSNRRLPSLNALRALEAVRETGSVSAAARRLSVSHSAISHQVKQLEAWIGRPVTIRRGRTVALQRYAHGDGLVLRPVKNGNIKGFSVKHDGKLYQENEVGAGILHGLFGKIPLLNILF